ncbi:MAG: DEAD/DEAH box helicase [Anaerolineales bacterium]|jgi:ATP-dependent RNA helicase DeaD
MTAEFSTLDLRPELVQAVAELGYETPTPIQAAVIPLLLAGRDVIGQAQTGTGKTAAFALPMLHSLEQQTAHQVQGLVVTPTRELALQVAHAVSGYGRHLGVRVLPIYGGSSYARQISRLKKGIDVVVGTPGRLLDLIGQGALDLSQVRCVVLDEADEMLSMGFIEDIEAILQETPETRQTALFSATLPPEIRRLAERYLRDPEAVTIARQTMTVAALSQHYLLVNEKDKLAALTRLFEVEPITSALIFARTRAGTGELANALTQRGFPAEALNGDLSQDMRERVLNRFRQDQITVLVATDVAARGLDIDDISHVINFDLPDDPEIYVHRVGRTGRAGKTGRAISLATPYQRGRLRQIQAFTRQTIEQMPVPSEAEILTHREAALMEQVQVWLKRGRCRRERELVDGLVAEGFDPLELAAVALKIARAEEKQRPIYPVDEVRPPAPRQMQKEHRPRRPRNGGRRESHEAGMVRLALGKGKVDGLRPKDVVSTIAFHADIPGSSIGKIQIEQRHTLVDVPEAYAERVLAGSYRFHRQPLSVELA